MPTAPNPPVILSVTTIDSQSVHVIWNAPTQPNGVLISYTITYTIDDNSSSDFIIPFNGNTVSEPHMIFMLYSFSNI